jgi:hypothetical protein
MAAESGLYNTTSTIHNSFDTNDTKHITQECKTA